MRILILTILFTLPFYYFQRKDKSDAPKLDSIKLKMGAPDRAERILTVEKEKPMSEVVTETNTTQNQSEGIETTEVEEHKDQLEDSDHLEVTEWTDQEAAWDKELKDFLSRVEPDEAEEIHKAYVTQNQSYQSEIENLLNEKGSKTTKEAIEEIEQLIAELDQRHQEKLKEILGAHYEAVRDHYSSFMDDIEDDL